MIASGCSRTTELHDSLQVRRAATAHGFGDYNREDPQKSQQVRRMVRAFVLSTRLLKSEKSDFLAFAQKKFGFSREVLEEAYKVMVDALSTDGFVEDRAAERHRSQTVANLTQPVSHTGVVDYGFLREALKK
jgi:hypothetical protein